MKFSYKHRYMYNVNCLIIALFFILNVKFSSVSATIVITYKDGYKILSTRQKDALTPESEQVNIAI